MYLYAKEMTQTDPKALSDEITSSISIIKNSNISLLSEIDEIMKLACDKSKIYDAFMILCALITKYNTKVCEQQESIQQNILSVLTLQRDQKILNDNINAKIQHNSNRIQSFETKTECKDDLQKVWIILTCRNELERLMTSKNLIMDSKDILSRMDIDTPPIRKAHFQRIKIGSSHELALCLTFPSAQIASLVRSRIYKYNCKLEEEGKLQDLRYTERIFWSKNVWKILKICWELKRVHLIESVWVQHQGIKIRHKISPTSDKLKSKMITCYDDIDTVRKLIGDVLPTAQCKDVYDNDYFKLEYQERDDRRKVEEDMKISNIDVSGLKNQLCQEIWT